MKKTILFAIISILAGACSSPKDQAKASPDGTMFEDIPATFDSSQHRPLHMAVALKADSVLVIGARGGFLPNTYYTPLTEHIGPSSANFRKRKPDVQYAAIHKESEEDPGKIIWALYYDSSRTYLTDSSGAFIALPGEGNAGGEPSDSLKAIRDKDYPDASIKPLSAFNVIAKDLVTAHRRFFDYPDIDWKAFGAKFLDEKLGLKREEFTTQISNYDNLAALFDAMKRLNTIQIDMNRDFWQYISMEYFKQQIKAGEVGSSAMPHKVNPIDFENAEGNLGMANAVLEHLARKLPVSRLQRDLTDSTVIRNVGVPFGHQMIAIASSLKGLGKLLINEQKIAADLDGCWSVVAEAIQTILRREGYPHPYEALKALTRTNSQVTRESISEFIDGLNVNDNIKQELKAITPGNYFGV